MAGAVVRLFLKVANALAFREIRFFRDRPATETKAEQEGVHRANPGERRFLRDEIEAWPAPRWLISIFPGLLDFLKTL